jgi:ABC-2 type transport system ATP-binding protein
MYMNELVCTNLTKVYDGKKTALNSISFSIPTTGIFALIGRNGAGKTTLIRILATELEPTSGTATINGLDVVREAKRLREEIAIVPQEARTMPWLTPKQTVQSYLLWRGFGYSEAKKISDESLKKMGLEKYAKTLNRKISGGTKRKVLMAMVLSSESRILFLDEPTSGLDPISRKEFWEILEELGKDRFIFLTTHYLEEAASLADRIGILAEGQLLAAGSLGELRAKISYEYSIKVPSTASLPENLEGQVTKGRDGSTQILTNEKTARGLSEIMLRRGTRFSISPVSLDDIFFRMVGREAEETAVEESKD